MYAPASPTHGSPTTSHSRYRQPSRHATVTSSNDGSRPATGNSPTTAVRLGGTASSFNYTMNSNSNNNNNTMNRSGSASASQGGGGRQERTMVGRGTVGSGATWEAQQAIHKQQHLQDWERSRRDQQSAEAARKAEAKQEADRKQQIEREQKRQMFLDNRFNTVFFTKSTIPSAPSSPSHADGSSPKTPLINNNGQQQPEVAVSSVVRGRSAAERRERNILPAAATSPLRQGHYKEVLKAKTEFVKERAKWSNAREKEIAEHEEYIQKMRHGGGNSPTNFNNSSGYGNGDGNNSPMRRRGSSSQNNNAGDYGASPQRPSTAGPNSMSTPKSPNSPNNNGMNGLLPPRSPTANNGGGASFFDSSYSSSTPRLSRSAAGTHRSPPRTTSPLPEYADECHRKVQLERMLNEADVLAEREHTLQRNRASRQGVIKSHYETYKSVNDLAAVKNAIVTDLRDRRASRDVGRRELTKQIRDEKYVYQKSEREQLQAISKQSAYARSKKARDAAEREAEAERVRIRDREATREAELKALQESADQRRVNCACSREGRAVSPPRSPFSDSAAAAGSPSHRGTYSGERKRSAFGARSVSPQTDDGAH